MAQTATQTPQHTKVEGPSLVKKLASRFNVDADKLLNTLKNTAFRQKPDGPDITNEQMMALLVVADQYGLNPFTKEIYAFPDKGNGIVPVVGVDGWSRIINEHKQFDGIEFLYSDAMIRPEGAKVDCHEWIDVTIYRKDRSRPITIREYLDEVYRAPFKGGGKNGGYTVNGPWQTHPKRFLRHKGIIQCGRIALGFTGIYDQDEAERIIDMGQAIVVGSSNGAHSNSPIQIEHAKIDPVMDQLIDQAKQFNAWGTAHNYIMSRFSGQEFAYAQQKLQEAERTVISEKVLNEPEPLRNTEPQTQTANVDDPAPSDDDDFVSEMRHHENLMSMDNDNQPLHF